jgi:hypothetical protein
MNGNQAELCLRCRVNLSWRSEQGATGLPGSSQTFVVCAWVCAFNLAVHTCADQGSAACHWDTTTSQSLSMCMDADQEAATVTVDVLHSGLLRRSKAVV